MAANKSVEPAASLIPASSGLTFFALPRFAYPRGLKRLFILFEAGNVAFKPWPAGKETKYNQINWRTYLAMEKDVALGETTNLLLFVAELVADSPNGENHLRVFRILFDLGAQPVDV